MTNKNIKKEKFSKRLRQLMKENNETIYTISEILDLSTSTISRYINQKMSPKITTIKILAQYFGVNPVWLMGYEVKKQLKNSCMNLSDEEKEKLKPVIEGAVNNSAYTVQLEAMDSNSSPFIITVPEFMRRMKEMQASGGGGMMGMGNMPDMYNLVVNTNSPLVSEILAADEDKQKGLISQAFDLAKLSQNLLHGEDLTNFIKRSYELIK